MSSRKIEFQAIVGENDVWVEATYTPGQPERGPSLSGPGEPAEGPVVEIYLVTKNGGIIDIEGLFIRKWHNDAVGAGGMYRYESVEERLIDAAFAHVAES